MKTSLIILITALLTGCGSIGAYTRYHSKYWLSVGIKMTLGKENYLTIVILWFDYLTLYKVILNPSKKGLSNITSSLL